METLSIVLEETQKVGIMDQQLMYSEIINQLRK
jgi:hypothetical protein